MFLKRVEMQGFKSFADKVVIHFEKDIVGIVGPNGCGKSNITDAIKWVLGEQSVKNLRGTSMEDVIFNGSVDRHKMNLAEVTLVFDNENKQLHHDKKEIEITRKLYRNKEAEYYINRNHVRLKDIVDLILDSGLGKDSLSIISQGNITQFAECKPIDRRSIFEEAAGVSKYKKRKIESLAKLERTKENLERVQDIVNELEKQVNPLKRQAKKAELFKTKKERLREIEIGVLVNDIEKITNEIETIRLQMMHLESDLIVKQTNIGVLDNQVVEFKKQAYRIDNEVNELQDQLLKCINQIQILEARKIELDEKRKYQIETGNHQEKVAQLHDLVSEAKFEYEDRQQRFEHIQIEMKLLNEKLSNIALEIAEENQIFEKHNYLLKKLNSRKDILDNLMKEPFSNQYSVKMIMDNQNSLPGVLGVVGQLFDVAQGYEDAISVAIGQSMYHIVTSNEESARNAIYFLKKNRAGRATFLPQNVLKERLISKQHEIICANTEGFCGVASDFVTTKPQFDIVKHSLLNNVLVCKDLESGNELAKSISYAYKIVTLEGDIIHRGGSMTGGSLKQNNTSLMTVKKELESVTQQIQTQNELLLTSTGKINRLTEQKQDIQQQLTEYRISLAQIESILDIKKAKYEKLLSDFEQLSPHENTEINHVDNVVVQLNEQYAKRDNFTNTLKGLQEKRFQLIKDTERKEQQLRQIRKQHIEDTDTLNEHKISIAKKEVMLNTAIERLSSEYSMTVEFAKNNHKIEDVENAKGEVATLRYEIENLGNVNMEAPEQFEEVNERYEFTKKQADELNDSCSQLLKAIDEMDTVMKKQFKDTFEAINIEFDKIFKLLFGGGRSRLILEDKNDLLHSGIDIDVQPPGKSIQNIRLLSGGEKSLIAICVLFAILTVKNVPLVILDEVEAALDQANVERFSSYLTNFANKTQFIVVTHRPGTMAHCQMLYGVTMQKQGVSQMLKVQLEEAIKIVPGKESSV